MAKADDERTAVVLDEVSGKLDGHDETAFNELIKALVRSGQPSCARMLDEELTEQYSTENDSKYGMQNRNVLYIYLIPILHDSYYETTCHLKKCLCR